VTRRDYLNPDYPPALCDPDKRADRLAHFAQPAPITPAPAQDGGVPHLAAIVIAVVVLALAAIAAATLGVV